MRAFLLPLFMLAALSLFSSDTASLAGTWKVSVRGDYYYYIFNSDSSMKIVHGADTTLAKYRVDTSSTNPRHLDVFILDRMSGEVLYASPSIFEWMSPDRIRLRMSSNMKDRPENFMPKGNLDTIILVRQKDK